MYRIRFFLLCWWFCPLCPLNRDKLLMCRGRGQQMQRAVHGGGCPRRGGVKTAASVVALSVGMWLCNNFLPEVTNFPLELVHRKKNQRLRWVIDGVGDQLMRLPARGAQKGFSYP